MRIVNIHAAKTHLSRLVDQVADGDEIVIARAGKPVAKLVPLTEARQKPERVLGLLAGRVRVSTDFDAALPDELLDTFDGA